LRVDRVTPGKSREEWAKEQQYIVEVGEVKIFDFKVFPAEMVGATRRGYRTFSSRRTSI
jgi:hypothetical protein